MIKPLRKIQAILRTIPTNNNKVPLYIPFPLYSGRFKSFTTILFSAICD